MLISRDRHLKPLPSRRVFLRHLGRSSAVSCSIIFLSLAIGMIGYHRLGRLPWVDALLNASMILTGMGPVDPMKTAAAKVFAAAYALFSGVVFLTTVGILMAPAARRFLHRLHLEIALEGEPEPGKEPAS